MLRTNGVVCSGRDELDRDVLKIDNWLSELVDRVVRVGRSDFLLTDFRDDLSVTFACLRLVGWEFGIRVDDPRLNENF